MPLFFAIAMGESQSESKDFFRTLSGEQDFYVLKFPSKLWRIINDCRSGAIRWGPYGKTILIDYNLFQSEYLECEVPKFKTRNMTSFVRQLNMYGFKKIQQTQMKISRFYNIHEFFHENFRFGRSDLLSLVKRRAIPLKFPKPSHSHDRRISRVELCRNTFEDTLLHSDEFRHFWKISPLLSSLGGGSKVIQPAYRIRIIPVQNITIDEEKNELTAILISDYERLLHLTEDASLDEPNESEIDENDDDEFTRSIFDIDFAQSATDDYVIINDNIRSIPVQVKNGFDGTNYIIDVVESGQFQGPEGQSASSEQVLESQDIEQPSESTLDPTYDFNEMQAPNEMEEESVPALVEEQPPTIHLSEDEDFFSCLTHAISGVDI